MKNIKKPLEIREKSTCFKSNFKHLFSIIGITLLVILAGIIGRHIRSDSNLKNEKKTHAKKTLSNQDFVVTNYATALISGKHELVYTLMTNNYNENRLIEICKIQKAKFKNNQADTLRIYVCTAEANFRSKKGEISDALVVIENSKEKIKAIYTYNKTSNTSKLVIYQKDMRNNQNAKILIL